VLLGCDPQPLEPMRQDPVEEVPAATAARAPAAALPTWSGWQMRERARSQYPGGKASYDEALERAVLEPNSHFSRGSNGTIMHATPAPPGWESQTAPLYFVDGVEVAHADCSRLSVSEIADIQIVRKQEAVQLYGERARGGLVIARTTPNAR
jgi:hypothetical protein